MSLDIHYILVISFFSGIAQTFALLGTGNMSCY